MVEYDIVFDLHGESLVFQFPLCRESFLPCEIAMKGNNHCVEVENPNCKESSVSFRGVSSKTINSYFLLDIPLESNSRGNSNVNSNVTNALERNSSTLYATKVKNIYQLRPYLRDTSDTIRKSTEKKETTRLFSITESDKDLENKLKNPNYITEKLQKEPWKVYPVVNGSVMEGNNATESVNFINSNAVVTSYIVPDGFVGKSGLVLESGLKSKLPLDSRINFRIYDVIYNARVVNLGVLREVFPGDDDLVFSCVLEMCSGFLGRYVLLPCFYGSLCDEYSCVLKRIEACGGVLVLEEKELCSPGSDTLLYLLSEITHRDNNTFVLKGYVE